MKGVWPKKEKGGFWLKGKTIDKAEMALLEAENNHWKDVLTRLVLFSHLQNEIWH